MAKPMVATERRADDDRFRALLDAAVDAIVLIDGQGLIARFNHAAERLFGFSEAELQGRNVSVLMPARIAAEHDSYLERYQRTREARIIGIGREVTGQRRDGTQFPLELSVGEFRHAHETGFVGILRDLSERVQQREAEAAARREIDELNASLAHSGRLNLLGEMASGIAHEVNQPITAIAAYAGACQRLLQSGAIEVAELRDVLDKIRAQAERAGQVINGLRVLARRQEPVQLRVNVNRLVNEIARLMDFELRASGWRLVFDLQANLPAVKADAVQIQQVLLNLVRNSFEAMLEQAHGDSVEISTAAAVGEVWIRVRDSGPGVQPAFRKRLFEPFQTTKDNGMGLGLSICQSIAQAHDGRLSYVDDGRPGACFELRLPVASD